MTNRSCLLGRGRHVLRGDEVLFDLLEGCYELALRARCYAARCVVQRVARACVHFLENRLRLRRQIQLHGAPIAQERPAA